MSLAEQPDALRGVGNRNLSVFSMRWVMSRGNVGIDDGKRCG